MRTVRRGCYGARFDALCRPAWSRCRRSELRYTRPNDGEWVQPVRRGYKLACCDCGLVHTLDFRVHKGRVQFRAWRNNRSTALMRRHMRGREKT